MAKAQAKAKKVVRAKTSTAVRLSAQDRKWQAQDDARTLIQAQSVLGNSSRLKAAKVQAKLMAKVKMEEFKAIKKVAKRKKL